MRLAVCLITSQKRKGLFSFLEGKKNRTRMWIPITSGVKAKSGLMYVGVDKLEKVNNKEEKMMLFFIF